MISRRFLSVSRPMLKSVVKSTIKPTESIPDVKTFLTTIGRNCHELTDTYENNWDNLVNWDSRMLKEKGVSVQQRKYILEQLERLKRDGTVNHIKKGTKSFFGSERHRKENIAKYLAEQRNKE